MEANMRSASRSIISRFPHEIVAVVNAVISMSLIEENRCGNCTGSSFMNSFVFMAAAYSSSRFFISISIINTEVAKLLKKDVSQVKAITVHVGNGSSITCYKYESATKSTSQTPYCSYGYDLTNDGKCLRTIEATLVEENVEYSCPEGYTSRGSGSNISCYKKTSTDSYYYCTNSKATLSGTRCIVPETTTFLSYSCPLGYDLSGNQCIKENVTERILATENDGPVSKEEVIWSKTKDLEGWTWTGNTKEA